MIQTPFSPFRPRLHFRPNPGPRLRFKGSSGTNTVTQQSGPPPQVLANYQQVYQQAQNVANQPTQPYNGSLVAGFTPMQQAGFNAIGTASNAAQPFMDAASQDMTQAGSALNPTNFAGTVAQYQSPYTQQVVNATEQQLNNQNAIQQNQLAGNAASAGAFGGDRQAVAQSVLAGQQQANEAPTIANLYNTGFQNATSAAQSGAYLSSQAGFGMGQLATEAQQQGLSTASADLSAGATQQQLAQEELNIPYESYLAAQSYPYQTTNWLEGMATGTGSGSGGTSATTSPGPSAASQIGGLGVAGIGAYGLLNNAGLFSSGAGAAGSAADGAANIGAMESMFANRGGRIRRAPGGEVPGAGDLGSAPPTGSAGVSVPNVDINIEPAVGAAAGLLSSAAGQTAKTSGGSGLSGPAQNTNDIASGVAGFFGGPLGGMASSLWTKEFPGISPGAITQDTFGAGNTDAATILGFGGLKRGGHVGGFAAGGNPTDPMNFGYGVPDLSVTMLPTSNGSARGTSTIPQPPKPYSANAPSLMQDVQAAQAISKFGDTIGEMGAANDSSAQSDSRGGPVGFGGRRPHGLGGLSDRMRAIPRGFDAGGGVSPDISTPAGLSASVSGNPVMMQTEQAYSGLPTNKLQQMATNLPPNTPQGQMIQRALQQRMIHPQSDPSQPSIAAPQPQAAPQAPQAGMAPMPQGFADGGTPDLPDWAIHDVPVAAPDPAAPLPDAPDPSTAPMPDSVQNALARIQQPQPAEPTPHVERAADLLQPGATDDQDTPPAAPALPPPQSNAPVADTMSAPQGTIGGFGPAPRFTPTGQANSDDSFTKGPWQAILAAGLGMMSGTSKFPLVNIGQGGMAGLKTLQSMPQQRTQQIQSEQAQDNLDMLRAMRGQGLMPTGAVGGMAPVGGGGGLQGGQTSGINAVGANGLPLFNVSNEYANAQYMMMSGIPAYVDAGRAKMSFLETVMKNGIVPTATGGVVPLSGDAEAAARKAGMTANAEAPAKIAASYAERSGTPLRLAPGETAVSGASVLPPSAMSLINRVTGGDQGAQTGASVPQPSPYSMKVGQDEAGLSAGASNGSHVGLGGFDPPTWLSTIRSAYPTQTAGLSDAQLLPLRANGPLSLQMIDQLARTNAPVLQQAGLPVNQASLRLAHWFGPQGAIKLTSAPVDTPVSSIFPAAVVQQNRLTGMTAGDVVRSVVSRYGTAPFEGAPTQQTQSAGPARPAPASPQGSPSQPAPSLQPTAATVPSMINVTKFPGDLPASQSMAAPHNVRNPDGSLTNSVTFAQRATQEAAGKFIGAAPAEMNKLNDTQLLLNGLHSEVTTNAASPGWYQSGAGAEWRTDIAKAVNGTVAAIGGKPPFDQAAIGNVEEFNKNSSVAAFSLARSMAGGRVALGEVTQANRSVPNMGNTPYGNIVVTHLLMQQNARESDRLKYQADQAAKGVDPNVAFETFNQQNPSAKYVAAASAGSVAEAFPQVVAALKGAPSPANITAFDRRYGEGAAEILLQRP